MQQRLFRYHGVSNHQRLHGLLNCWFRRRLKKPIKAGLRAGNAPVTGEFPAQKTSNAENLPIDDVIMPRIHSPTAMEVICISFSRYKCMSLYETMDVFCTFLVHIRLNHTQGPLSLFQRYESLRWVTTNLFSTTESISALRWLVL